MSQTTELAVIDFLTHSKVRISATPAKIWPRIVDMEGWRTNQTLVPIRGEPDQAGARFHAVATEAPDTPLFEVENAEMVPERRRTIRLEGLDGHFIGFATWELTPVGAETVVAYDVYCRDAMLPPGHAQADLLTMAQQVMDEGLQKLKAVVEG
jgi:carbon monoxide dehydrogenase subunit G